MFNFGEIQKFLGNLNLCNDCPSAKRVELSNLDNYELKEWGIIQTEKNRIDKELERTNKEKEIVVSRESIFINKIQLRIKKLKAKISIKQGKVFEIHCKGDCPYTPKGLTNL